MSFDEKVNVWMKGLTIWGLILTKYEWYWKMFTFGSLSFSIVFFLITWFNVLEIIPMIISVLLSLVLFVSFVIPSNYKTEQVIRNAYKGILQDDEKWNQNTIRIIIRKMIDERLGDKLKDIEFVKFFLDALERRKRSMISKYPAMIMVLSAFVGFIVGYFGENIFNILKVTDKFEPVIIVLVTFTSIALVLAGFMTDKMIQAIKLMMKDGKDEVIYYLEDILEKHYNKL